MSHPLSDNQFWRRVKELYDAAWDLAPAERAAFLSAACGDDHPLRAEVEALLSSDDDEEAADLFIDRPLPFAPPAIPFRDLSGEVIGHYRLTREIGRGGMSLVYLGERDDGDFEHQVAVKILRPGYENSGQVWRFAQERRILARLTHPHIARLLDGGTTAEGMPYVVIEFVDGKPIDEYCASRQLSLNERLRLFLLVCDAVAHAHRHLIIHRDLKPGNILVAADGTPKLLDFGIAKLLDPDGSETLRRTLTGMHLMTPDYASPEQVRGEECTTTADVYSLGVVLYELLAGVRPHRLRNLSLSEIVRVICEEEPTRPSAVAQTGFGAQLRGDLDQIVLKALRKEKDLRYQSVEMLAEDLRRYLNGEPVSAQRDTIRYRTLKFVRRNRPLALALGAILALLILMVGMALRQLRIERGRVREQYRMSYAPSLQQALTNYNENDIGRMRERLERFLPGRGPEDLRGFEWRYLWGLINRDALTLDLGECGLVHFTDDDRLFNARLDSGRCVTFDLSSGRIVGDWHLGFSMRWPKDALTVKLVGRQMQAVVRNEREIHILDMISGRLIDSFAVEGARITGIDSSYDLRFLLITQEDGVITRWEIDSRAMRDRIETAATDLLIACDTASERFLRLVHQENHSSLYDLQERRIVRSQSSSAAEASGPFFDDLYIYERAGDRLRIHEIGTGRLLYEFNNSGLRPVLVNQRICGLADADTIWVLARREGAFIEIYRGQIGPTPRISYNEDAGLLITADSSRTIKLLDLTSKQQIAVVKGHEDDIVELQIANHARLFHSMSRDGVVKFWRVDEVTRPEVITPHAGKIYATAISPDSRLIAAATEDPVVRLWDLDTGQLVKTLTGHTSRVFNLAFSPDGRRLITSGEDRAARVWDLESGRCLFELPHRHQIHGIDYSPDARMIATASDDRTVGLWDGETGRNLAMLEGHDADVWTVAFDPAGRRLYSGDISGRIKVWDVESRRELRSFTAHRAAVWSIRFTRDGSRMLTSSMDHTAKIWDVEGIRESVVLRGHADEVFEAVFSPDETRIATASNDRKVKIWNAATGEELLTLDDHGDEVWSVAFSADGRLLASGSWDGTIRLYRAAGRE